MTASGGPGLPPRSWTALASTVTVTSPAPVGTMVIAYESPLPVSADADAFVTAMSAVANPVTSSVKVKVTSRVSSELIRSGRPLISRPGASAS